MKRLLLLICTFLFVFSTTAYCSSTKISFSYIGAAVDVTHLASIESYWVIVNKEKVGVLFSSGGSIPVSLKAGDKVSIAVHIKDFADALVGPNYVIGDTTQALARPGEPLVQDVVITFTGLQEPIIKEIRKV